MRQWDKASEVHDEMIPANLDPEAEITLALRALVWTLSDDARADRLLAVTGLDAGELRQRAGESALLAATLSFLESHEPDLLACAEAIGHRPDALVAVRRRLENA